MPEESVTAEWLHDQVFLLRDHNGYPIQMSQPDGVQGADLLPLSVIGCAAWDLVSILHKQRQPLSGLSVRAVSQREAEPPWHFQSIHIYYTLQGTGLDPNQVQRAVTLSEQKYCSTFATLSQAVEIRSEFEIVGGGAPLPVSVEQVVQQFNGALNRGDVAEMMRWMTEDCVFENTYPPPAGERFQGQAAVRAFWEQFFLSATQPRIEIEELVTLGERAVMRWTYHWRDAAGNPGFIRGIDLYAVRDGLIAEKLSYVKG
jgi:uncharacterized OsmC-like protein/ketosteroid isomerase-like protein